MLKMFTLTMLKTVLKNSIQVKNVLKISRCVESHVENFKACWKPCQKYRHMLKTISKMSTHVENMLKISYEKNTVKFWFFSQNLHNFLLWYIYISGYEQHFKVCSLLIAIRKTLRIGQLINIDKYCEVPTTMYCCENENKNCNMNQKVHVRNAL